MFPAFYASIVQGFGSILNITRGFINLPPLPFMPIASPHTSEVATPGSAGTPRGISAWTRTCQRVGRFTGVWVV